MFWEQGKRELVLRKVKSRCDEGGARRKARGHQGQGTSVEPKEAIAWGLKPNQSRSQS